MDNPCPRLTASALRSLAIRPQSRGELRQKLTPKLKPTETGALVESVLDYLESLQLIDDASFARNYAQMLLRRGQGPKLISYKLAQKGLEPDTILNTVTAIGHEAVFDSAYQQTLKYLHRKPAKIKDRKIQAKLIRHLYTRGYPSAVSFRVIDEVRQLSVQ